MQDLVQIIASGLSLGAVYALAGLSLNIVYVTTGIVNFAQGAYGMVAVLGAIGLNEDLGIPFHLSVCVALVVAAILAAVVDLVAVQPLERTQRGGLSTYGWIVSTLGASIAIENSAAIIFGTNSRPFPSIFPEDRVRIAGAGIGWDRIGTVLLVVALVLLLGWVTQKTQIGRVARAVAENRPIASSFGVNIRAVRLGVVLLSGVIVGIAAVLVAPQIFANPFIGTTILLNGFVAVVVAGFGNIRAGLFAGLALGLLYAITGRYAPSSWLQYLPFLVLIAWIMLGEYVRAAFVGVATRTRLTRHPQQEGG